MMSRWCLGMTLGVSLLAAPPAVTRAQAWVLALDERGGVVPDLKPSEFQVKADGKSYPVVEAKTPAQTQDAPQSWILVFEPIRDTNLRAVAFTAAADFLTKVPGGDRVFIVARGKDSLESLMPGFSVRRAAWAEALARVPDMLPESFVGSPKETLQGAGFQVGFADTPDGDAGQDVLNALLGTFRSGAEGWAKGTVDVKGVNVLDRLNFDNPTYISAMLATVAREGKALASLIDQISAVGGQKHLIVFSRCEADDLAHPMVKRAMTQPNRRLGDPSGAGFQRTRGDMGGPAESAANATRDMTLLQAELRAKAVMAGVTLYSVAGAGQNVLGHVGTIASDTGGFAFPLVPGLVAQFGQGIQVFGSRYLLRWQEDGIQGAPKPLSLTTTRKGVKVMVQTLR